MYIYALVWLSHAYPGLGVWVRQACESTTPAAESHWIRSAGSCGSDVPKSDESEAFHEGHVLKLNPGANDPEASAGAGLALSSKCASVYASSMRSLSRRNCAFWPSSSMFTKNLQLETNWLKIEMR